MRVLLTGAAGFIGSAVAADLAAAGYEVVGIDVWLEQAHGVDGSPSTDALTGDVVRADVRDLDGLEGLLRGVDVVCHQAAMVGAGLSAADLPRFASHNDLGTATLLAAMASAGVRRLVLASSMVVYGDGRYVCVEHDEQPAGPRALEALRSGRYDVECPQCGRVMDWRLVDERSALDPRSGYAASKVAQEHYAAAWARQTGASAIALRYHNVYGPDMPADTPYAGVAAFFRSAVEHGSPPRVFEDGGQMRDFVHVDDVAAMNRLAIEAVHTMPTAALEAFNVCSAVPVSVADVARLVAEGADGPAVAPVVTGEFRPGDVRHIVASPHKARASLGFSARVHPGEGLPRFAREPLRGRASATTA